jgi:hypothetical protein
LPKHINIQVGLAPAAPNLGKGFFISKISAKHLDLCCKCVLFYDLKSIIETIDL